MKEIKKSNTCYKCQYKRECNDLMAMGFFELSCEDVKNYAEVGNERRNDEEHTLVETTEA